MLGFQASRLPLSWRVRVLSMSLTSFRLHCLARPSGVFFLSQTWTDPGVGCSLCSGRLCPLWSHDAHCSKQLLQLKYDPTGAAVATSLPMLALASGPASDPPLSWLQRLWAPSQRCSSLLLLLQLLRQHTTYTYSTFTDGLAVSRFSTRFLSPTYLDFLASSPRARLHASSPTPKSRRQLARIPDRPRP